MILIKGKEIIRLIKENRLEDFDLEFILNETTNLGINIRTFKIDNLCDIGCSENAVSFSGDEK